MLDRAINQSFSSYEWTCLLTEYGHAFAGFVSLDGLHILVHLIEPDGIGYGRAIRQSGFDHIKAQAARLLLETASGVLSDQSLKLIQMSWLDTKFDDDSLLRHVLVSFLRLLSWILILIPVALFLAWGKIIDGLQETDGSQIDDESGAAIAEKWQRDTRYGHDADRHADVFKGVKDKHA